MINAFLPLASPIAVSYRGHKHRTSIRLGEKEQRMKGFTKGLGAALLVGGFALFAHALDQPSVVRIVNPGVGNGNRPAVGGSAWALVHLRGMLEEEFKADGIKVTWNFLRGAGPA